MEADFTAITSWPVTVTTGSDVAEARAAGQFPRSWGQGRATFGGAVTAVCVRVARRLVSDELPLRSVDTVFFGPVAPGREAEVTARVVRSGKYVTSVETLIAQDGQPCARATTIYGRARPSHAKVTPPLHTIPPAHGDPVPHVEGVTPIFIQHFELTWAVGSYPFMGAKEGLLGGHCRHRGSQPGEAALVALIDAWPAPVLPMMPRPGAASSVHWTAHLVDSARFDPGTPCFFEARVLSADEGYATTVARLYAEDGALIAWSEQLVAYFEV